MMLGFLLARAGVEVLVLEKHADFLRDFRGDTVHPSTLEIIYELGLLDNFLKLPHQEVQQLHAHIGNAEFQVVDFSHLSTRCTFIAFMPQWDFLSFIATNAKQYPSFHLRLNTEAKELIIDHDRVIGLKAHTPGGTLEVHCDLVVGADGRHSTVREQAELDVLELGAPMDVLWMRISKLPNDPGEVFLRMDYGKVLVMIDRGDYYQCGFVIPKGGFEKIRQQGLNALHDNIATAAPFIRDRMTEIHDWSDVHVLTVMVDRLHQWFRPGLLCIGDAAHAMSPIGGVGVNLAIQDAVAAGNILADPLRGSNLSTEHLEKIQRRRELPTRIVQRIQIFIQNRVIDHVLKSNQRMSPPLLIKLLGTWPMLRRIPGYLIGNGIRPEHAHVRESGAFKR